MLDLYQAEVARILHLQCADISRLAQGQEILKHGSSAWIVAQDFVRFYQLLHRYHAGQGVPMRNWLRRQHNDFSRTPHLMLVDDNRLQALIQWLESHQPDAD